MKNGTETYIWSHSDLTFVETGHKAKDGRIGGASVKVSNRFLKCGGSLFRVFWGIDNFPNKSMFLVSLSSDYLNYPLKNITSCQQLYDEEGILPDQDKGSLRLWGSPGKILECSHQELVNETNPCPFGWVGEGEKCFKIVADRPSSSDEANRICNDHQSDLIQIDSEEIDNLVRKLIVNQKEKHFEMRSIFYHFGTYRRGSIDVHYHRNGGKM